MGTTVSQMPSVHGRLNGNMSSSHSAENTATSTVQGLYRDGVQPNNDWPQQQQDNSENVAENPFGAGGRQIGVPLFPQPGPGQSSGTLFDRDDQVAVAEAANIAHQQEQRGVSHLSNAVSAVATNGGLNRNQVVQGSPSGGPVTGLGQMAAGLGSVGSALTPGNQLSLEKRGPVEFNHAIGYVNKIKVRMPSVIRFLFFLLYCTHWDSQMPSNASINNLISISNSLKSCRLTSASQSLSRTFMPKLRSSSMLHRISLKTSSSSCRSRPHKPKPKPLLDKPQKTRQCLAMFAANLPTSQECSIINPKPPEVK